MTLETWVECFVVQGWITREDERVHPPLWGWISRGFNSISNLYWLPSREILFLWSWEGYKHLVMLAGRQLFRSEIPIYIRTREYKKVRMCTVATSLENSIEEQIFRFLIQILFPRRWLLKARQKFALVSFAIKKEGRGRSWEGGSWSVPQKVLYNSRRRSSSKGGKSWQRPRFTENP